MNKAIISSICIILITIALSSAQSTLLGEGLVGYWKLDETSGAVIESVSGLHGTNNGATTGLPGLINNAYSFSGNTGVNANLGTLNGQTATSDFTYSLWFKNTGQGGGYGYVLSVGINKIIIGVNPSTGIFTYLDTTTGSIQSPNTLYSFSNFNHVLITYDGSTFRTYINGLQTSVLYGGNLAISNPDLRLGTGVGGSNSYTGLVDEVGFWNRPLTPAEISLLYNSGEGIPFSSFGIVFTPTPPTLAPIGNQQILENQTLTIQLNATDPNPYTNLTFLTDAQTQLPSPSFLNSTSGLFTWTPTFQDHGIYNVTFYVTDGQFIDYETIQIQVIDVSFATINLVGNTIMGSTVTFNLHDPEHPNSDYRFAGSFGSLPGIPLPDGRVVPLNNDWLLSALLYVPQLFGFFDTSGTLDSQGNAQVTWNIPNIAGAQGANLAFSFVTLDYSQQGANVITSIAPAVNVTLQ